MNEESIINLANRAVENNVNGYDVIEVLRLAIPILSDRVINEINSVIEHAATERGLKPGDAHEPTLFSREVSNG